ncbi:hypothetical protein BC827DRAFT_1220913 [Russula dissimulans]|nr:hypothetical protein BC827DRAFT_1220913 [Russula dissimulans]
MLEQESLSESSSCCSKLGRHAGDDSRWVKTPLTSLIEHKGLGGRLIGDGLPDTVLGPPIFADIAVTIFSSPAAGAGRSYP